MKSLLKQMIVDFHSEPIPKTIIRSIKIPDFANKLRKANVFIGMRRSGKTYLMYQQMHHLMKQGILKQQLLYINFEDDRLNGMAVPHFQMILEAYWELYPEYINNESLHFFFY